MKNYTHFSEVPKSERKLGYTFLLNGTEMVIHNQFMLDTCTFKFNEFSWYNNDSKIIAMYQHNFHLRTIDDILNRAKTANRALMANETFVGFNVLPTKMGESGKLDDTKKGKLSH